MKAFALPAVCLLLACHKPQPAAFCSADLSGLWRNASDRHFAYRLRDHGEVIRGEFLEGQPDGGLAKPADPITFELHRTRDAVAGVMRGTGEAPSGRVCPVEYGMKLTSCSGASFQAVVETAINITDDCQRLAHTEDGGEVPPELSEFRFDRDETHPSPAGEPPSSH